MSEKDVKKGVEIAVVPHYTFMRKQGEATAEVGKRIIQKIDNLGKIIDCVIDEASEKELNQVFGVYSALDIGQLDLSEQKILFSCLKTLCTRREQSTPQQQEYYLAVKRYLNIPNISDDFNFASISQLDITKKELKTFFECVCEFLFLKKGSTSFLQEFAKEIEAFEFNEKAINEIIAPIEKTYQYFGVQGIIEHYSLVPLKRDEEEKKPFEIPFFKKPIVIIYDEKDKEGETYAELLMTYIHETLDSFGLSCPVSKTSDADAHAKMERFEKEEYIIYVGEPKHANSLIKAIETKKKWEFKKYGMRYGNLGYQSILSVQPIKKKQYSEFLEFIKEKESRWEEDASKTVTSLKTPTCEFEKGHGGEAIFVNFCLATTGSPLWLAGSLLDLISKPELKKQLIKLQYCVLIDEFVSSKVNPYIQ